MSATMFVSYSHADGHALDRLHKHLSMLEREGLITAWIDQAILPGGEFTTQISEQLERSAIFVALLSADYLSSSYCYEKEFARALELYEIGGMTIVPIILEPCDWQASPFQKFVALPKDGKPISEWTNENNAYLDIVNGLRRLTIGSTPAETAPTRTQVETGARRVRVKRDFDAIDRAEFSDRAFKVMRDYFDAASAELAAVSEDLRTSFEDMSASAFTCTIVNRAQRGGRDSHITVRNQRGRRLAMGDINYVFEAHAENGASNGMIRIDADDYDLFLTTDFYSGRMRGEVAKLTPEAAAEWLWDQFVGRAGVSYE
jgi:hypothetical protein